MGKAAITPRKPGWYWYRWDAVGTHYTPVYCDVDPRGDWFISDASDPDSLIGYLGELPGAIVQWIGEAPDDEDQN